MDPKAPLAFVANASQDTITVIDTDTMTVAQDPVGRALAGQWLHADLRERHTRRLRPALGGLRRGRRRRLRALAGEEVWSGGQEGAEEEAQEEGRQEECRSRRGRASDLHDLHHLHDRGCCPDRGQAQEEGQVDQAQGDAVPACRPDSDRVLPDRRGGHRRSGTSSSGSPPAGSGWDPTPTGRTPSHRRTTTTRSTPSSTCPRSSSGASGVLNYPSDTQDPQADADRRAPGGPGRRQHGARRTRRSRAGGPIKHVFYIVRENRTYDQVLGDDPRGDGDPSLTLFGSSITPNAPRPRAALPAARPRLRQLRGLDRRPLLDRGGRRLRLRDQELASELRRAEPALRLRLVRGQRAAEGLHLPTDAARATSASTTTARALAGLSPFADKDRTDAETDENSPRSSTRAATDVQINGGCYDSDISIFDTPAIGPKVGNVYDSTLRGVSAAPGRLAVRLLQAAASRTRSPRTRSRPSTTSRCRSTTPQGLAARQAARRTPTSRTTTGRLGQIVDEISHSSIWDSSLILVVEDDSQNGADHVDAHRIPALVISPYTQQGAVVHNRYDQLSFLRTLEIISGPEVAQPRRGPGCAAL